MELEIMSTRIQKRYSYHKRHLCGIAKYCDWFCFYDRLSNITKTDEPKIVFLSHFAISLETKEESILYFITNHLPKIKNKFILIIASDDASFPTGKGNSFNYYENIQEHVNKLINHEMIIKIFVENLDTIHDKLIPLPLGVLTAYGKDIYYNDLINQKELIKQERSINVLCCHKTYQEPHLEFLLPPCKPWKDRQRFDESCSDEPLKSIITNIPSNLDEEQYKNKLLDSRFNICIHGGGIDPSPKAWQSILAGSIPIIQHSTLDASYKKLPVVFVDNFDADTLTIENLNKWYDELKDYYFDPIKRKEVLYKLSVQYWLGEIKSHLD